MVKKVWGVIFVVLGVGSFLVGLYKYNQVNNFVNLANTFGFPSVSDKMTSIFQNAISSAYQESYIFLGVGIILAIVGSYLLKDKKNREQTNESDESITSESSSAKEESQKESRF